MRTVVSLIVLLAIGSTAFAGGHRRCLRGICAPVQAVFPAPVVCQPTPVCVQVPAVSVQPMVAVSDWQWGFFKRRLVRRTRYLMGHAMPCMVCPSADSCDDPAADLKQPQE